MNSKEIDIISNNFCIPDSLKTDDFKVTVCLNYKHNSISSGIINYENSNIECFQKQAKLIYEVKLKKVTDLLNCINFFKSFKSRTSNLIRFENWDDDKEFDFITDYYTKFYFLITNVYRLYNYYHINCIPFELEYELKNIIKRNFLNI